MKKLFIFSLVALIFVLIFFVAYNVSFRSQKAENTINNENETLGVFKNEESVKKIISLGDSGMLFPKVDSENNKINYFSPSGELFSVSFTGELRKNSNRSPITGIKDFIWSPSRARAIILMAGENGEKYYAWYDGKTGTVHKYEENMDYAVWSGSDERILYKKFNPSDGSRILMIADFDGKNARKIANIPWKMVSIYATVGKNNIFFWSFPFANEKTQLKKASTVSFIDGVVSEAENIGKETERYGADYLWSNRGDKVLISSFAGKMELGFSNGNGENYEDLKMPTLVSKCVWSKDDVFIYCAVPSSIDSDMMMPDDYQNEKFFTKDIFWKINIQTGERNRLVELNEITSDYDAKGLFLSPSEDALFFTNRLDEKLYRINL
ncbi:MAG: Uncharacterized protein Athens071425_382 [Parcubacteria group bacterium Athens0714_25]|uniref:Translocation protein TolB n=1 Tax=Candidatus Berkelbacteria bacterium Athens1014_28 TaxID=2017145 RepID=A0A554LPS6_9BACT|nr:MAG: Uncharacterized protein Athens101428_87 [Candidatus Berkelbacteria bacterium Athens1014_28]TSD01534.1 MAG: Uncharacterized protein Athens071425_382 [Parcubacteria group bacterium Athens0714_25]